MQDVWKVTKVNHGWGGETYNITNGTESFNNVSPYDLVPVAQGLLAIDAVVNYNPGAEKRVVESQQALMAVA